MDPNPNNQPENETAEAATAPVEPKQSMAHGTLGFTPPPPTAEPEAPQPTGGTDAALSEPAAVPETPTAVAAPAVAPSMDVVTPAPTVQPNAVIAKAAASFSDVTPVASGAVVGGDFGAQPVVSSPAGQPAAPTGGSKPTRKLAKVLVMVLLVVLVIGGGSAAAYMGVIVPNKPINVLKKSFANSLQSTQTTFNGMVTGAPTASTASGAYKVLFNGGINSASQAFDFQTTITYSGISLPVEVRYVGGNAYFKVGDLSSLTGIVKAYLPAADDTVYNNLVSKLSNQWFEVDSTLIDQSPEAKCLLQTKIAVSNNDLKILSAAYDKNQFVTITSSAGDTVNKQNVEKYNLSINDDGLTSFLGDLNNTSAYKSLQKCSTGSSSDNTKISSDHSKTAVTVWVDKGKKQIVQVATATNAADAKVDGVTVDFMTQFGYPASPVSVAVPSGAQPISELYSDLAGIYGAGSDSGSNGGNQSVGLTAANSVSGLNLSQLFKRL